MTAGEPFRGERLGKHRVEALTDGIYAVAMTLLVLELKIPETATLASEAQFEAQLAHLAPKLLAWLISFLILAIFWISHQRVFRFVKTVDPTLLWINLLSLLLASLLPFSSALVGEHSLFFAAQALYAANVAGLGLVAVWQIGRLARHPCLCEPPLPPYVTKAVRFRSLGVVASAALAVAIAAIEPPYGTLAFILMFPLARYSRRMEARGAEQAALLSSDRPFP